MNLQDIIGDNLKVGGKLIFRKQQSSKDKTLKPTVLEPQKSISKPKVSKSKKKQS